MVAGLIDEDTGELRVRRAPHRTDELVGWLGDLAGPVRVAYEAGPSGFGLARACEAAGIECLVAAPSLIARSPAGRGKKSDVADAAWVKWVRGQALPPDTRRRAGAAGPAFLRWRRFRPGVGAVA